MEENIKFRYCTSHGWVEWIGFRSCQRTLRRGASVYIFDVSKPKFQHDNLVYVYCDLDDEQSVNTELEKLIDELNSRTHGLVF